VKAKVSTLYKEGKLVGGNEFGKTGIGGLTFYGSQAEIWTTIGECCLPFLQNAQCNSITKDGISLSGIEQINGVKYYQEWWCRVGDWSEE